MSRTTIIRNDIGSSLRVLSQSPAVRSLLTENASLTSLHGSNPSASVSSKRKNDEEINQGEKKQRVDKSMFVGHCISPLMPLVLRLLPLRIVIAHKRVLLFQFRNLPIRKKRRNAQVIGLSTRN